MTKLEDLKAGAFVKGIAAEGSAKVITPFRSLMPHSSWPFTAGVRGRCRDGNASCFLLREESPRGEGTKPLALTAAGPRLSVKKGPGADREPGKGGRWMFDAMG